VAQQRKEPRRALDLVDHDQAPLLDWEAPGMDVYDRFEQR